MTVCPNCDCTSHPHEDRCWNCGQDLSAAKAAQFQRVKGYVNRSRKAIAWSGVEAPRESGI